LVVERRSDTALLFSAGVMLVQHVELVWDSEAEGVVRGLTLPSPPPASSGDGEAYLLSSPPAPTEVLSDKVFWAQEEASIGLLMVMRVCKTNPAFDQWSFSFPKISFCTIQKIMCPPASLQS
jgi:hypothetical protein